MNNYLKAFWKLFKPGTMPEDLSDAECDALQDEITKLDIAETEAKDELRGKEVSK